MPKWEYLEVKIGVFGLNSQYMAPQFVNDQLLKDWKRIPLHEFINRLGADGWEMSGTLSLALGNSSSQLFFKRPKP